MEKYLGLFYKIGKKLLTYVEISAKITFGKLAVTNPTI